MPKYFFQNLYEKQEYTKIKYYIDGSISLLTFADYYTKKRYET